MPQIQPLVLAGILLNAAAFAVGSAFRLQSGCIPPEAFALKP